MWYFAWILGVGLALAFSILNGLWHEMHLPEFEEDEVRPAVIDEGK